MSKVRKVIMAIATIMIIISISILYILYTNKHATLVETNNGYKTFSFTIDDILEAYGLELKDTSINSTAPYCKEHSGTVCVKFPQTQYVDMSVVYESKSRKVISIEMYQNYEKTIKLEKDNNPNFSIDKDGFKLSFDYLINNVAGVFKVIGKDDDYYKAQQNPDERKNLIMIVEEGELSQFKGELMGFYQFLGNNMGAILCSTSKGLTFRVIASGKKEFYNLSLNSLANLVVDDELKKENENDNPDYDNVEEQVTAKPLDKKQDIVYTLAGKSYPIINLDSSDVKKINAKIKQNYAEEDDEYCSSEYKYYLNNEILSLVITQYNPTSYDYEVYNINVNSGKTVSNADLLKIKNIDENTFLNKLQECYKNKFREVHSEMIEYNKRI